MAISAHAPKTIKILAIEDDEFMRIFLRDVFWLHGTKEGYLLEIVSNLEDARGRLKKAETIPDVILLDLMLPAHEGAQLDKSAGFTLLKEVKSNPDTKHIQVIMFSGYSDKELQDEAMRLGAEAYLVKGEHLPQDLIAATKRILFQPAATSKK